MRRASSFALATGLAACGLSVSGLEPLGNVDGGTTTPTDATAPEGSTDDDAASEREPPRPQDPDADPPTSDAGDVFLDDAGPITTPPACVLRALLLVDKDSTAETPMASALTAAGFTVSTIGDYSKSNGEGVAAFDPRVVVLLAGVNYKLDITGPLQTAVKNALAAGAGLVTEEWAGYEILHSHFQGIAPYVLFSYSSFTNAVTTDFTKVTAHPIWNGLPSPFRTTKKIAFGIGKTRGTSTESIGTVSAPGVASQPGIIVRDNGKTRVAETTIAVDYYQDGSLGADPNIRRLFVNMALWAAHCDVPQ